MSEASSVDGSLNSSATPKPIHLAFHADGNAYFRIWMVNLALTILTLGIYSAWAKVRTKRYFYRSTELAGDHFDYLANPVTILKGRMIAVGALLIYTSTQILYPKAGILMFIALLIALPWIVARSVRFNAIMSAWRGIRFGFDGGPGGAAAAYLGWRFFGLITLGLGMPFAWFKQNQYLINHHRFGRTLASTSARPAHFYLILFALIGAAVAALPVSWLILFGGPTAGDGAGDLLSWPMALSMLGYFVMYLWMYVIYQAMHFKAVYNNVSVDDIQLRTNVTVRGWLLVAAVNSILMILTLGLYYPWASVRMRRYVISHLWVLATDLDGFIADETDRTTALGEEFGEAFDLGIGV